MPAKARKKLSPKNALKALKKTKALILDIDGVLTDGRVFYVEGTGFGAFYSVIDGFGMRLLLRNGIEVCVISAGNFESHRKRAELLGIRHAYFGDENKLKAYQLQDKGYDTVTANLKLGFAADLRDYGIGAQILADLGLRRIELLTNNPRKVIGLEAYGLTIEKRSAVQMKPNKHNRRYLSTKRDKLGHRLPPEIGAHSATE